MLGRASPVINRAASTRDEAVLTPAGPAQLGRIAIPTLRNSKGPAMERASRRETWFPAMRTTTPDRTAADGERPGRLGPGGANTAGTGIDPLFLRREYDGELDSPTGARTHSPQAAGPAARALRRRRRPGSRPPRHRGGS